MIDRILVAAGKKYQLVSMSVYHLYQENETQTIQSDRHFEPPIPGGVLQSHERSELRPSRAGFQRPDVWADSVGEYVFRPETFNSG